MNEDFFSSEYIANQYDQMAQAYNDNRHKFDNSSQLDELDKLVSRGDDVLDVGCGSGIPVARYFVEHGCEVVGFDLSEEMIRLARRNVPEGEFLKADLMLFEYPPDTYDLVVSFYCIFHIKKRSQKAVFKSFHQTLKPGRYSYFTLACEGYTNEKEFEGTRKFHDYILPYAHYSEEQYRDILEDVGFNVLSMKDLTIGGETMLWVLVRK